MERSYADYVLYFKALSDETRLRIVEMLFGGELCACDILENVSISQSTLSYHMKTLTDSGVVNAVRDGAWMRYSINEEMHQITMKFLADMKHNQAEIKHFSCE